MSTERVVVASKTGPVTEVIQHGVNGLLVDFFDISALASQVIDVLVSPETYRSIGKCARQSVVKRYYHKSKCLPQLIKLVEG